MQFNHLITALACLGSAFATANAASNAQAAKADQVDKEAQSAARAYDLDIAAPVQVAGSDAAAKEFQTNALPGLLAAISQTLPENIGKARTNIAGLAWDASRLTFNSDTNARIYFLGQSVGYQNALGISTTGGSPLSPDSALIFPNVSTPTGKEISNSLLRSPSDKLVAGDFVDLGSIKAGSNIDFFLLASGATTGKDFYSTNQSLNRDGLVHAVSFAPNGSTYLIIGFEDGKNGGDQDYNDFLFAMQFESTSGSNAHIASLGAPEPSLAAGALLTALALLGFTRRRHH